MLVVKPPTRVTVSPGYKTVFLAGSIEMETAEDWQQVMTNQFVNDAVVFFNPRREDWDSTWEQSKDHPQFRQQVEWELDHLSQADIIVMYLDPATKSPVSLLELGLMVRHPNFFLCCPTGFWRKGNVDIVCERYGVKQVDSLEKLINLIRAQL